MEEILSKRNDICPLYVGGSGTNTKKKLYSTKSCAKDANNNSTCISSDQDDLDGRSWDSMQEEPDTLLLVCEAGENMYQTINRNKLPQSKADRRKQREQQAANMETSL